MTAVAPRASGHPIGHPAGQSSGQSSGHPAWDHAVIVASLFALSPYEFGGVRLRALPGPVRDEWLDLIEELLGPTPPFRRMPASITEGRLLGGLDLGATLAAGKPIAEKGLLAECDGGVVVAAMAERLPAGISALLAQALDRGVIQAERDGLSQITAAHVGIIAIDEGLDHGMDGGEGEDLPAASLLDRLAFQVPLASLSYRDLSLDAPSAADIGDARERLNTVTMSAKAMEALATASVMFGIPSMRPVLNAIRAARGLAALAERASVSDEDVTLAAQLCLAHQARTLPPLPQQDEPEAEDAPPPEPQEQDQDDTDPPKDQASSQDTPLEDVVLDAAVAAIPSDLLARLKMGLGVRRGANAEGKAGAVQKAKRRGRPAGIRPGDLGQGLRLNVIETLRTAAPWQAIRRQNLDRDGQFKSNKRVHVTKQDFRFTHLKHRSETATVFVVDASGSAALHRLAEVKGAVELLLAECYIRRDQVSLIAFRGEGAEIILPPTRSLVRAKRQLAGLPGGGGTPLASGLEAAALLADSLKRKGMTPVVVVLTDGRPNITRSGAPGRQAALEDAKAAAKLLQMGGINSVLVDSSPRRHPQAEEIARDMDAFYLPLPHATSESISRAVGGVVGGITTGLASQTR